VPRCAPPPQCFKTPGGPGRHGIEHVAPHAINGTAKHGLTAQSRPLTHHTTTAESPSRMILPVSGAMIALRAAADVSAPLYNTTIQIPTQKPPYAEHLSPQLAGFSIEMDRWPDWAGQAVGQPNEYTNQLLRNLGERTGAMPYLRVGGQFPDMSLAVGVADAQPTRRTVPV